MDNLRVGERPEPQPGHGEVRVRMRAAALNAQHCRKPLVDCVFAFDELHAALARLASGKHFGKICIEHSPT